LGPRALSGSENQRRQGGYSSSPPARLIGQADFLFEVFRGLKILIRIGRIS
jgi:hypothetical protein